MSDSTTTRPTLDLTAQIVAAHVGHHQVPVDALPALIQEVYRALAGVAVGSAATEKSDRPQAAVPIKRSVFPDYLVCLEDGKKLKMLKRHLRTAYNLTPAQYRERWGLQADYPMVAPSYASHRSALAKSIGLGRKRPDAKQPKPEPTVTAFPARRAKGSRG